MNKKIKAIAIVILVGIISFSAYNIWNIENDYKITDKGDEELRNNFLDYERDKVNPIVGLKEQNPDTIGWIKYDKLNIDLVMLNDRESPAEKEYYLRRDFNGKKFTPGEIYVNQGCQFDDDGSSECSAPFIYGHSYHDRRFDNLNKLIGQKTMNETDSFTIETENTIKTYQVFGVATGNTVHHSNSNVFKYYNHNNWTEDEFADIKKGLIQTTKGGSFADMKWDDEIVVLSTCFNKDLRIRVGVFAKLVETVVK